jgi:hypothetical protein
MGNGQIEELTAADAIRSIPGAAATATMEASSMPVGERQTMGNTGPGCGRGRRDLGKSVAAAGAEDLGRGRETS